MTAPLCTVCRLKPVKPAFRYASLRCKMGPRIVNGAYWNWCCSRKCSTSYSRQKALTTRLHNAQQRHVVRLVALVKPHMDADGKVPAKAFVKEWAKSIQKAYNRGYNAAVWPRKFDEYREHEQARGIQ